MPSLLCKSSWTWLDETMQAVVAAAITSTWVWATVEQILFGKDHSIWVDVFMAAVAVFYGFRAAGTTNGKSLPTLKLNLPPEITNNDADNGTA